MTVSTHGLPAVLCDLDGHKHISRPQSDVYALLGCQRYSRSLPPWLSGRCRQSAASPPTHRACMTLVLNCVLPLFFMLLQRVAELEAGKADVESQLSGLAALVAALESRLRDATAQSAAASAAAELAAAKAAKAQAAVAEQVRWMRRDALQAVTVLQQIVTVPFGLCCASWSKCLKGCVRFTCWQLGTQLHLTMLRRGSNAQRRVQQPALQLSWQQQKQLRRRQQSLNR
jgi:hypothetical protein